MTQQHRASTARTVHVIFACALAVAATALPGCSSSGDEPHPCLSARHCELDQRGTPRCEDGYEWDEPDDDSNFDCRVIDDDDNDDDNESGDGDGDSGDGDGDPGDGDGDGDPGDGDGDGDGCIPTCSGKTCGADGCGGICGVCSSFEDVCLEGECTAGPCPSDVEDCEGECADLYGDPNHCGACGYSCPSVDGATRVCSEGACDWLCPGAGGGIDFDTDPDHCGGCGNVCPQPVEGPRTCEAGVCAGLCPSGESVCGDTCVDLEEDAFNCGTCGNICPVAEGGERQCVAGNCAGPCPAGYDTCNVSGVDVCIDTDVDADHCGSCGFGCDAPSGGTASCLNGGCQQSCFGSESVCSGTCVNTLTDPSNCGFCGNTCSAPVGGTGQCSNGSCIQSCPSGMTNCGGTCVDLSSDFANCGACGDTCQDWQDQQPWQWWGDLVCHEAQCKSRIAYWGIPDGWTCEDICASEGVSAGCVDTSDPAWWPADGCFAATAGGEPRCPMPTGASSIGGCGEAYSTSENDDTCISYTYTCGQAIPQAPFSSGGMEYSPYWRWCTCGEL